MQIKIITDTDSHILEEKVNEFIKNKIVLSVSYSISDIEYSCCIAYQKFT